MLQLAGGRIPEPDLLETSSCDGAVIRREGYGDDLTFCALQRRAQCSARHGPYQHFAAFEYVHRLAVFDFPFADVARGGDHVAIGRKAHRPHHALGAVQRAWLCTIALLLDRCTARPQQESENGREHAHDLSSWV